MTLPRHDPGVSPESPGIPDPRDSTPIAREEADPAADPGTATDAVASGAEPDVGGFSAQELAGTVNDEFGDVL